jgi:hypothetical protein
VTAPFRLLARLPDAISGRSRAVPPSSSDAASAAPPPSSDGAASAAPPSSSDAAAPLVPEPVLLGASAPRRVTPTEKFLVRFAAYIEAAEAHVSVQFRGVDALERRGDRQVALGLPTTRASRWVVGAPVTVRLRGDGVTADPPSHVFEWNGRYNLLFFTVSLAAAASAAHLQLMLEAFIEGVPVGCVPLTIEVGEGAPATQPITSVMRPFSTAFASYASQDAPLVSLCLSALHRWDPGMQVFMDCLDLTPNENWKRELEAIIPTKDAFLLFWSVNARKSEWVAWELKVATSSPRGVESVLPMPLEDPAVAPPPDVLKHLHFRDRYLLARAALTKTARATL